MITLSVFNPSNWTFTPPFGWIVAAVLCALMLGCIVVQIVWFAKQQSTIDMTLGAVVRRSLMCLLVACMALGPARVQTTSEQAVQTTDLIIAVDTTGSMAVNDAHYGSQAQMTRLDAAALVVKDIVTTYATLNYVGISFASSSRVQVPLTPDSNALIAWADNLVTEPTSLSQGSSLDEPISQITLSAQSIREQHPDDQLVLVIITDGEQTSGDQRDSFSALREFFNDALVIGVGSSEGGTIPLISDTQTLEDVANTATSNDTEVNNTDSDASNDEHGTTSSNGNEQWVIDPSTLQPGISAMDEHTISDIADELGGRSLVVDENTSASDLALPSIGNTWRINTITKTRTHTTISIWWLAVLFAAVALWEFVAWLDLSRRLLS